MPVTRSRPQGTWVLSAESFEQLLRNLDPSREAAADRYERLRQKLTAFFDWRGLPDAETAVDETFDRLARRLLEGEPIEHVTGYAYGVARIVLKESLRRAKQRSHRMASREHEAGTEHDTDREERQNCLDKCLDTIPPRQRELILDYYDHARGAGMARHHKAQADSRGLSAAALRVAAYRIRLELEQCVEGCMAGLQR